MAMQRLLSSLVGVFFLFFASCTCAEVESKHTTIVLFGATGDLSRKYLWQSIFNVYSNILSVQRDDGDRRHSNHSFSFIGVAQETQEKGTALLHTKLQDSIQCGVGHFEPQSLTGCENRKKAFIGGVQYVKISDNSQDLITLCSKIQKGLSETDGHMTLEVIMYMAIPAMSYVTSVEHFEKTCFKTLLQSNVKIRWALEKPFGLDRWSAQVLADQLQNTYDEKELYHVDHYLQKSLVKTMMSFRSLNGQLEKIWNRENIDRVEIFLKETLDVKGRIPVYNSMGVLRDIHQNHLTELLVLTAMDLPWDVKDAQEISELKAELLRHIESVKTPTSLFGQYAEYANHASSELSNDTMTTDVPTFAAVLVKINSARWKGVPFLLVSGKHLDQRESFVRVVFKNAGVCVSQCKVDPSMKKHAQQVVFHIGGGDLVHPSILVSKSLGQPVWPENLLDESQNFDLFKASVVYQTPVNQFYSGVIINDIPAYQSVIRDLVNGKDTHFATTQRLLLAWHIWDFIATAKKNPRIYERGDISGDLNFRFNENKLEFVYLGVKEVKEKLESMTTIADSTTHKHTHASPALYLGRKLITASASQLPSLLAKNVADAAKEEVNSKGVFHIAFSGGSSISQVLHSLAHGHSSLPWDSIHAWQVDERCVPHHDEKSNFDLLDRELFRHVNIPFSNIHALPVDTAGDLCDESLGGPHLYTETIKKLVLNAQFDFVILGLGRDGHTASLFPESTALHVDSDTYVTISDDGPHESKRRMSLTLPIINRSKRVAVLVTGSHKRDILQQLETSKSFTQYPILGVNPSNGTITWYIDDKALPFLQ